MTPWRYTDDTYRFVVRELDDGTSESVAIAREDVQLAIAAGEILPPPDAPTDHAANAQALEERNLRRVAKKNPLTALLRKARLK